MGENHPKGQDRLYGIKQVVSSPNKGILLYVS